MRPLPVSLLMASARRLDAVRNICASLESRLFGQNQEKRKKIKHQPVFGGINADFLFLFCSEIKQELFVANNKFRNSGFPAQRSTWLLAATAKLCDERLVLSQSQPPVVGPDGSECLDMVLRSHHSSRQKHKGHLCSWPHALGRDTPHPFFCHLQNVKGLQL